MSIAILYIFTGFIGFIAVLALIGTLIDGARLNDLRRIVADELERTDCPACHGTGKVQNG